MPITPAIRPYRPEDLEALRNVCVRTGLGGGDATGHYQDPGILPAVFAEPYAVLEPDLVFVVDQEGQAVGYVLGTADTERFVTAFRERWLPVAGERYPLPAAGPEESEATGREIAERSGDRPGTLDALMRRLLHSPERMLVPALAGYPAHLHIDLLPHVQGRGFGRRLVHSFWDALRARGVPGVHLSMSPENTAARAFYDRLGFREVRVPDAPAGVDYLVYPL